MSTLNETMERLRKKADEAKSEYEKIEALAATKLFDDFNLHLVYNDRKGLCVSLETETREEATKAADHFIKLGMALPCIYVKGTFASFKPAEEYEEKDGEIMDEEVHPVCWKVSGFQASEQSNGLTNEAELHMWLDTKELPALNKVCRRIDLRIKINKDPATVRVEKKWNGERHVITGYSWHGLPNGEKVRYSSGTHNGVGDVMCYFENYVSLTDYMSGKNDLNVNFR